MSLLFLPFPFADAHENVRAARGSPSICLGESDKLV